MNTNNANNKQDPQKKNSLGCQKKILGKNVFEGTSLTLISGVHQDKQDLVLSHFAYYYFSSLSLWFCDHLVGVNCLSIIRYLARTYFEKNISTVLHTPRSQGIGQFNLYQFKGMSGTAALQVFCNQASKLC